MAGRREDMERIGRDRRGRARAGQSGNEIWLERLFRKIITQGHGDPVSEYAVIRPELVQASLELATSQNRTSGQSARFHLSDQRADHFLHPEAANPKVTTFTINSSRD